MTVGLFLMFLVTEVSWLFSDFATDSFNDSFSDFATDSFNDFATDSFSDFATDSFNDSFSDFATDSFIQEHKIRAFSFCSFRGFPEEKSFVKYSVKCVTHFSEANLRAC